MLSVKLVYILVVCIMLFERLLASFKFLENLCLLPHTNIPTYMSVCAASVMNQVCANVCPYN